MTRLLTLTLLLASLSASSQTRDAMLPIHAPAIGDSLFLRISVPETYADSVSQRYPVVYLLDANLYFDIMAATFHRYSEVGLLPPAILVGVGYKNFAAMDSLRARDYTFPRALPEYEMNVSDGGAGFYAALTEQIIPELDAAYRTDTSRRILLGHSLGGYFVLYALQQGLAVKTAPFSGYVAASPSADYNRGYILNALRNTVANKAAKPLLFVAFGGLEDAENREDNPKAMRSEAALRTLSQAFKAKTAGRFSGSVYSGLGHMDMPLPAFVKGIQWMLETP